MEIAQLVSLTVLNLADNDLSGEFPDLSGLNLEKLNLTSNANLTGVLSLKVEESSAIESSNDGLPLAAIIAISVGSIAVLIAICAFVFFQYFKAIKDRKRRARDQESCGNSSFEMDGQSMMSEGEVISPINAMPNHMMELFGSKKLRITSQISKGGFGFVYLGVYEGRDVAVKRLIAPKKKKAKLRLAQMFSTYFLSYGSR